MASREEIISTVKEFLSEEFEVEKSTIEPEANLQETLDLDSLEIDEKMEDLDNFLNDDSNSKN